MGTFPGIFHIKDALGVCMTLLTGTESALLFDTGCGLEDLYFDKFLRDDALLACKKVQMIRRTFPGGHDWSVWRRCLHDFLPLLFRK